MPEVRVRDTGTPNLQKPVAKIVSRVRDTGSPNLQTPVAVASSVLLRVLYRYQVRSIACFNSIPFGSPALLFSIWFSCPVGHQSA